MIEESIRRLMQERGYTIKALSAEMGWSTRAITRWRTGKAKPSKSALQELSRVFCVSADEIRGRGGKDE